MISYERVPAWRQAWLPVTLVVGGLALGLGWWQLRSGTTSVPDGPATASQGLADHMRQTQPTPGPSALLVPPVIQPDGRPSDFTSEEWAALKSATATAAQPAAELTRLIDYLRFQKGFAQWQAMQNDADQATRRALGERLLAQVPDRLHRGEIGGGEAVLLQQALLADLEPDSAVRQQRLAQAQQALKVAAPESDPAQQARDAGLQAEYRRREAAIVADFRARPEAQRDPARLEEELEAARLAVYGKQN